MHSERPLTMIDARSAQWPQQGEGPGLRFSVK